MVNNLSVFKIIYSLVSLFNTIGDEFIAKLKETIEKIQESNDDDSSIWDLKTVQGSPQTNILEDGFESFDTVDIYDSDGTFCEEG